MLTYRSLEWKAGLLRRRPSPPRGLHHLVDGAVPALEVLLAEAEGEIVDDLRLSIREEFLVVAAFGKEARRWVFLRHGVVEGRSGRERSYGTYWTYSGKLCRVVDFDTGGGEFGRPVFHSFGEIVHERAEREGQGLCLLQVDDIPCILKRTQKGLIFLNRQDDRDGFTASRDPFGVFSDHAHVSIIIDLSEGVNLS